MAHHSVDEQARFGEGECRDIREFTELELLGYFFVAGGLLASTRCDVGRHCV